VDDMMDEDRVHFGTGAGDEGLWISAEEIHAELWYPRNEGSRKRVVIGLSDVRAASDITVEYDFDRDGWSVTREVYREVGDELATTGTFVEVCLIPAWTIAAP
jgi:hypothetical protein